METQNGGQKAGPASPAGEGKSISAFGQDCLTSKLKEE